MQNTLYKHVKCNLLYTDEVRGYITVTIVSKVSEQNQLALHIGGYNLGTEIRFWQLFCFPTAMHFRDERIIRNSGEQYEKSPLHRNKSSAFKIARNGFNTITITLWCYEPVCLYLRLGVCLVVPHGGLLKMSPWLTASWFLRCTSCRFHSSGRSVIRNRSLRPL